MSVRSDIPGLREHENAYNIFILVLTIMSLVVMAVLVLPIPEAVRSLLTIYDNFICLIFLGDFLYNLSGSRPRTAYFIQARGWLDLLGSIPSLGFFQYSALLRLARLSRLTRIVRLLRGDSRKELIDDVLQNRGQYATFITVLSAGLVLAVSSVLVLLFEESDPDANIKSGGDALWWGLVTITTVGYGDRFPVTLLGRITALFVMLAGVGIIGALASILASILVPDSPPATVTEGVDPSAGELVPSAADTTARSSAGVDGDAILARLDALQAEVAAIRTDLAGARNGPSS